MVTGSPHRLRHPAFRTGVGTFLGTAAAAIAALLIRDHARNWMPLAFVLVVFAVAEIFGSAAGILSSLLAALVFALWLFPPVGDLAVQNAGARASLGWMILAGTSLSFLFAPPGPRSRKHR